MAAMQSNKKMVNMELEALAAAAARAGRTYGVFTASLTSAEKEQIVCSYLQDKAKREQEEKEMLSAQKKKKGTKKHMKKRKI